MKLIITKIKEHLGLFLTAIFFLTVESLSRLERSSAQSYTGKSRPSLLKILTGFTPHP